MSMKLWSVSRVVRDEIVNVGVIVRDDADATGFLYLPEYAENSNAMELSCSLPLTTNVYPEVRLRPYFEGLLPEGEPRRALALLNGVNEDDYLELLDIVGRDCIGDVIIYEHDFQDEGDPNNQVKESRERIRAASYRSVTLSEIDGMFKNVDTVVDAASQSRLSLAGAQQKIGLAHEPCEPIDKGWFQPLERAASTHILKISESSRYAELELICMGASPDLGIVAANTSALNLSKLIVVSERFDREVIGANAADQPPSVYRLHQEDFNQAFGFKSGSKYAEVEGGSYRAIANLLRERSISVAEDLEQLARVAVFNYLVGNCDNHLKNLSVLHVGPRTLKLAPAYDILSMTVFENEDGCPRWSRRMGMRLGNATMIDDVVPGDFTQLANDLAIGRKAMARVCAEISDGAPDAIEAAAERFAPMSEAIPYTADDLKEDMAPRLSIMRSVH